MDKKKIVIAVLVLVLSFFLLLVEKIIGVEL